MAVDESKSLRLWRRFSDLVSASYLLIERQLPRLWRAFLHVVAAICFSIAIFKLWADAPSVALASLVAAAASALIANLDRLDAFTLGAQGMTAKMRATIDEAHATIQQLRSLAVELGGVLIYQIHGNGRMGGETQRTKQASEDKIVALLNSLGVSEAECDRARRAASRWHCTDHLLWLGRSFQPHLSGENYEAWRKFYNNWINNSEPLDVEKFNDLMRSFGELLPEEIERIEDLRVYVASGRHRRPAVWAAQ